MSLIFATQLTAVATAVLAAFAVVTAWYARQAFLQQSKQLDDQRKINEEQTAVLRLQAKELGESLGEREREAQLRRRLQASRVFLSLEAQEKPSLLARVVVVNTSDQPVYAAETRWYYSRRPKGVVSNYIGTIMPGDRQTAEWPGPEPNEDDRGEGLDNRDAILTFQDASGVSWMRKQNGDLAEVLPGDSERVLDLMLDGDPLPEEHPYP